MLRFFHHLHFHGVHSIFSLFLKSTAAEAKDAKAVDGPSPATSASTVGAESKDALGEAAKKRAKQGRPAKPMWALTEEKAQEGKGLCFFFLLSANPRQFEVFLIAFLF